MLSFFGFSPKKIKYLISGSLFDKFLKQDKSKMLPRKLLGSLPPRIRMGPCWDHARIRLGSFGDHFLIKPVRTAEPDERFAVRFEPDKTYIYIILN